MRKIPTLFVRSEGGKLVTPVVNEGCEWVIDGEGVATVKFDGSCCMVRDGVFYRRYIAKVAPSPEEAATIGFIPVNDDGEDGHRHGWIPVGNSPNDQYHREAWAAEERITRTTFIPTPNGTWELVGPKVQGNPYRLANYQLWKHGSCSVPSAPRTFDELSAWLIDFHEEGLVWWRNINDPNCDKVKIKRRDFGLAWPLK